MSFFFEIAYFFESGSLKENTLITLFIKPSKVTASLISCSAQINSKANKI